MNPAYEIIIYYKYTKVPDPAALAAWQRAVCSELSLTGRILVASEGINGTVEGTVEKIATYTARMHALDGSQNLGNFSDVWFKTSPGTGTAFKDLKVKVREEIVTLDLGQDDFDPNELTGTHLDAAELKRWIENGEDFEIVDMRNDYEYKVGHFEGSINLGIENFRDVPRVLPTVEHLKNKKVLTVCTYGVRCEKASGYLKKRGFTNVYQLKGGIGTYMKAFPGKDFLGSLYVFDGRMLEQPNSPYEVVGTCEKCGTKTEHYTNCALDDCHKKMIVCVDCERARKPYCSTACETLDLSTARAEDVDKLSLV